MGLTGKFDCKRLLADVGMVASLTVFLYYTGKENACNFDGKSVKD